MIRVLLVDDHALVREGLRRLLTCDREDLAVVGEAEDGREAVEKAAELKPDVVLLDLSMPRKDGVEATGEIAALGLGVKILILTMFSDAQHARRTLRAGADGFIWKGAGHEELMQAISTVQRGERYLPPGLEDRFSDVDDPRRPGEATAGRLSRRELQVMCYLATGMNNREIAEELGVSVKTVDTHRGHVLKKLRLRNNSDITRFAIRHGFVEV